MFSDQPFQQVWDVTRGQSGTDGILIQYGGGSLAQGLTPPGAFTDTTAAYTRNLARTYRGGSSPPRSVSCLSRSPARRSPRPPAERRPRSRTGSPPRGSPSLGQIEPVFPGTTAAWTGRGTLSAWHLNPYSYGAYSCWPVGYVTTYAGYEGTAQGNLHFSGEHTSYDFQGYMNGGAVEGARAATEVLTALGR